MTNKDVMPLPPITRDWVCYRYARTNYVGVQANMFWNMAEAIAALSLGQMKLFAAKTLEVATKAAFLAAVKATIPADPPDPQLPA